MIFTVCVGILCFGVMSSMSEELVSRGAVRERSSGVLAEPVKAAAPPVLAEEFREQIEGCEGDPWQRKWLVDLLLANSELESEQRELLEVELGAANNEILNWERKARSLVLGPVGRGDLRKAAEGIKELRRLEAPPRIVVMAEAAFPQTPKIDGLVWKYIPRGEYWIGTPPDQADVPHGQVRQAIRKYTVKEGFFISDCEVTQAVYERYAGGDIWSGPDLRPVGADYPAHSVSYDEALSFCIKMSSEVEGFRFSIPLETEWEVAANGMVSSRGDLHPFSVGSSKHIDRFKKDQVQLMKRYGFFKDNSKGEGLRPVRQKLANAIGLYDAVGNVMEWCRTDEDYFGPRPNKRFYENITKGGSYLSRFESACSSSRTWNRYDSKKATIGFRLICRPVN